MLEKLVMVNDHRVKQLEKQVATAREQNEYLTSVIADAARRVQERAETPGLGIMLQALQVQLEEISRERGDIEAERERLIEQQGEMIKDLREQTITSGKLLVAMQQAFVEASSGDDVALQKIVESFRQVGPSQGEVG